MASSIVSAGGSENAHNDGSSTPVRHVSSVRRLNQISKDEFFMGMAVLASFRSKDPRTQVGCAIVSPAGIVVAIGYNGFPWGCADDDLPWAKDASDPLDTKFPYVCHAEMNAILNAGQSSVKGCTLFTTLFPCCECAKTIIQAGIAEIVYISDKSHGKPSAVASRRMLELACIRLRQFVRQDHSSCIEISFSGEAL
eukprot:Opistho-2@27649